IAANPSDPELKVQMGGLLLYDGKTEEALAAFREILELSPGPRVLNEGAMTLLEHKQHALAREFLTRLVATDPSVENRLELAVATFHALGPEASLEEIEKISVANRNGDVYLLKAQVLDALGRFEESVDSLNAGFRMEPKRADLYLWASLFLLKHKRDQQALALLEQATNIVPDAADLLLTKAVVLELVRKTEQAEDLLKKIQSRWPEWGQCYLIQGIIQATHRKPKEAIRWKPNLAEANYSLMIAYRKLGRANEAMVESDIFRRIREQNPESDDDTAGIRQMLFASDAPR